MTYALLRVADALDWRDYHRIRRSSLWEERGLTGYDDARPQEHLRDNHALLLKLDGRAIATTRRDDCRDGRGIVRLVAVTADERGKGHGRVLNACVEDYALALGISTLFVSAAREAERFYTATGWVPLPPVAGAHDDFIAMQRTIRR